MKFCINFESFAKVSFRKIYLFVLWAFSSGDDIIGKVTLSRKDMLSMNPAGGEVWYSLRQVDNASEVHGQLHLNILATKHVSTDGLIANHQVIAFDE